MAFYTTSVNGVALSTTNDLKTFVTTATGAGSVIAMSEYYLAGEAGASAVCRVAINRPSAVGITGAGAQTPEKVSPASVAAAYTVYTGWTTQPVLVANDVQTPTFNAFGGVALWGAPPGQEIVVGSQGAIANLSVRSRSGTSTVSGHFIVEER
jgi:hypothetical protein